MIEMIGHLKLTACTQSLNVFKCIKLYQVSFAKKLIIHQDKND